LGGLKDLPRLISSHQLTGVVVTTVLSEHSRAAVANIALQHGLELSEWSTCEQIIVSGPTEAKEEMALEAKSNS